MRIAMSNEPIPKLSNKAYRDAYMRQHLNQGLAFQIRALRESRNWTQAQLAERLGLRNQSAVARMEDPSYGGLRLKTISKLASVFDVATLVRFATYSKFLMESADLSDKALAPKAFDAEEFQTICAVRSSRMYSGPSHKGESETACMTVWMSRKSAAIYTGFTATADAEFANYESVEA
jgi:transcriptional regulator with XRE-family HTH domain